MSRRELHHAPGRHALDCALEPMWEETRRLALELMRPVREEMRRLALELMRPVREEMRRLALELMRPVRESNERLLMATLGCPPMTRSTGSRMLKEALNELQNLPEDQQLDFIHAVYGELLPSEREAFLGAALAQYMNDDRRRTFKTERGILFVERRGASPTLGQMPVAKSRTPLSENPPIPGQNGATWDDVFDWYHRVPRYVCPNQKTLAELIPMAYPTVRNRHSEYKAQYGERPRPQDQ